MSSWAHTGALEGGAEKLPAREARATAWVVMRTAANIRFVLPILEELAARSVRLHLSFSLPASASEDRGALCELRRALPGVAIEDLDLRDTGLVRRAYRRLLALSSRELRSYVEQSLSWPVERVPRPLWGIVRLARRRTGERSGLRSAVVRATRLVERACPPPAGLVSALGRLRPDVVVVTPMIYPASREIDVVKAAASTGIPSVGIVLSWDNLSTKGSFHALPDELIVWNDGQPGRPRAPFVRSHPTTSARPRSSARSSSPSSVRVASIDPPPAPPTSSPRPRAHHSRRWRRQRRRLPSGQAPEARTFDDRSVSP